MFDIEAGIQRWRQALLATEALRAEHVDELEDHLRSEFEQLRVLTRAPVLSEEEVFLIATRRLGRVDQLAVEFAKADPGAVWRRRWMWMLGGYLTIGFAGSLLATFSVMLFGVAAAQERSGWWGALYFAANLIGIAGLFALARSIGCARWALRLRTVCTEKLLTATGLVLFTMVAMAAKAAVSPISRVIFTSDESGAYRRIGPSYLFYGQLVLWLTPFVFLALLIWRDRERLRTESALASNDGSK